MKKEFLQNLKVGGQALPDDVVQAILDENGRDVEAAKAPYADYGSIKDQLDTAKKTLKDFEGVDVNDLRGKITTLQNDLATKEADYQGKLADMTFDHALEKAITGAKGRNAKAIAALLDVPTLKASKNQEADIKAALEGLKTVKNIHGILHKALKQAVANGYMKSNPTENCVLPRIEKKELMPLDDEETKLFLRAIKGHRFELLFTVTLFTGLREGEALGLTWDRIDFKRGSILINRQLQKEKKAGGEFRLVSLKNDRPRRITPAPWVMQLLKDRKLQQYEHMERAGEDWSNPLNLVFTNELGGNLIPQTVVRHFKEIVTSIGRPDARFHDLRHSYAVASIRSGDDIKTVQGNLGHATAAFTLDVYGHVTDQMREASSMRMQAYIQDIMDQVHQ